MEHLRHLDFKWMATTSTTTTTIQLSFLAPIFNAVTRAVAMLGKSLHRITADIGLETVTPTPTRSHKYSRGNVPPSSSVSRLGPMLGSQVLSHGPHS